MGLLREEPGLEARGRREGCEGGRELEEVMAELGLGLGPTAEPKPRAPALDLVSCSPGQQLEGHK